MKLRKNATVEEQYRSICKYIYGYALGGEAILGILSAAMLVSLVGQLVGGSFGDMFKGDDGICRPFTTPTMCCFSRRRSTSCVLHSKSSPALTAPSAPR